MSNSMYSAWLEQSLPDGRRYWYNVTNGKTVWEQPPELTSTQNSAGFPVPSTKPLHKPSSSSDVVASWRELTAANGRKYYYNAVTKVSMWEIPPEYAEYLERMRDPASLDKETLEMRFMSMLKEMGITSKYSWEEALRIVINHPHYKLVPTLAERKNLFSRHIELQKEVEREERHQRLIKDRHEFIELLKSVPNISTYSRFIDIQEKIGHEEAFKAIKSNKERMELFDDFIIDLRREEAEKNRQRRRRAAEKYMKLLESMSSKILVNTSWRDAQKMLSEIDDLRNDEDLSLMEPMERLICFEDYIKNLERLEQAEEYKLRDEYRRKERLNRKEFKKMLRGFEEKGLLTASTSWREFHQIIKGRDELLSMLSQPGSTPLDLFWDHINLIQDRYVLEVKPILELFKSQFGENWINSITLEDFKSITTNHSQTLSSSTINALRSHLFPKRPSSPLTREEVAVKVDEYRRDRRKQLDRLKHFIKHFSKPSITIDSIYEQYLPILEKYNEFNEVEDEAIRRYYFDKYIRHLKKKAGIEVEKSDDEDNDNNGPSSIGSKINKK